MKYSPKNLSVIEVALGAIYLSLGTIFVRTGSQVLLHGLGFRRKGR